MVIYAHYSGISCSKLSLKSEHYRGQTFCHSLSNYSGQLKDSEHIDPRRYFAEQSQPRVGGDALSPERLLADILDIFRTVLQ